MDLHLMIKDNSIGLLALNKSKIVMDVLNL